MGVRSWLPGTSGTQTPWAAGSPRGPLRELSQSLVLRADLWPTLGREGRVCCHVGPRKGPPTPGLREPLGPNLPAVRAPGPTGGRRGPCVRMCPLSSLQASTQADDTPAPSHLEFKFEPEDFAFPSTALGPQAGLRGALRQEAWCALALA